MIHLILLRFVIIVIIIACCTERTVKLDETVEHGLQCTRLCMSMHQYSRVDAETFWSVHRYDDVLTYRSGAARKPQAACGKDKDNLSHFSPITTSSWPHGYTTNILHSTALKFSYVCVHLHLFSLPLNAFRLNMTTRLMGFTIYIYLRCSINVC